MRNNLDTIDEEAWIAQERWKAVAYMAKRCQHADVNPWPAFHLDPHVALWSFRSPTKPGCKGCWAISGDIPTDCTSCSSGFELRDAMRHFCDGWLAASDAMERGEAREGVTFGTPEQWPAMASLLKNRARILREYADDDDLWVDQTD